MCFSAVASFVTAGVTGGIGIVSLARAKHPREMPLAAMPIFFAVQQSIEGVLWLNLPATPDESVSTSLTLLFLLLADVFWPVYAPITVLLIEPSERRRRYMCLGLAMGAGVAAYLLWRILTSPHGASISDGHIVYAVEYTHPALVTVTVALAYLAASSLAFLLSSQRILVALGTVTLAGGVTAYAFYWEAFVSVWCFFAAVASTIVLGHFERARRQQLRMARA